MSTPDLNSPIDRIQSDCMTLRTIIRGWFVEAKERVAVWEPAPMPSDYTPEATRVRMQ